MRSGVRIEHAVAAPVEWNAEGRPDVPACMADADDWNRNVIEEFRANGGEVRAFRRQPLLLLTHTGARTGATRTNPLAYFLDDDRYVIVASKGGAPTNPDWYHNLLANPTASVELGTEMFDVTAEEADPEERERLWAMITDRNPAFAEYEGSTDRTMPVMILRRVQG